MHLAAILTPGPPSTLPYPVLCLRLAYTSYRPGLPGLCFQSRLPNEKPQPEIRRKEDREPGDIYSLSYPLFLLQTLEICHRQDKALKPMLLVLSERGAFSGGLP
jgi:hypothetical protein